MAFNYATIHTCVKDWFGYEPSCTTKNNVTLAVTSQKPFRLTRQGFFVAPPFPPRPSPNVCLRADMVALPMVRLGRVAHARRSPRLRP